MSFLRLKTQASTFFEQQLDSTRQRLDSNCLMENPTASRLTEVLDSLDSLDSNLEARGGNKKPCNIGNSVQKTSKNELNYPQTTTLAANDTQAAIDLDWRKLIYGISTEDLLYNHLLTCAWCHIEAAQYCLQGDELGKAYDELLQAYDDAQDKRQALSLRVDKAKIARSYR